MDALASLRSFNSITMMVDAVVYDFQTWVRNPSPPKLNKWLFQAIFYYFKIIFSLVYIERYSILYVI